MQSSRVSNAFITVELNPQQQQQQNDKSKKEIYYASLGIFPGMSSTEANTKIQAAQQNDSNSEQNFYTKIGIMPDMSQSDFDAKLKIAAQQINVNKNLVDPNNKQTRAVPDQNTSGILGTGLSLVGFTLYLFMIFVIIMAARFAYTYSQRATDTTLK